MSTFAYQVIEKPRRPGDPGVGPKKEVHKDPFDRLIITHAITMNVPVVSPDSLLPFYEPLGLQIIWK